MTRYTRSDILRYIEAWQPSSKRIVHDDQVVAFLITGFRQLDPALQDIILKRAERIAELRGAGPLLAFEIAATATMVQVRDELAHSAVPIP